MVIAADDISKGRETLFYPLNLHGIWQGIAQMLQFLVCGCSGDEKTVLVAVGG